MADKNKKSRGGHGGSVEIIGGSGIAVGGSGGRGGSSGSGRGGDGGGGKHYGSGYVRGGDGGDAGRPARPALGALSSMCYLDEDHFSLALPGIKDIYGIPQPGKGGDSYTAYVIHDGYEYCLNILLNLVRTPMPNIINKPEIIDAIDELGVVVGVKTEQEWWDLAVEKYPEETSKAMSHIKTCEAN